MKKFITVLVCVISFVMISCCKCPDVVDGGDFVSYTQGDRSSIGLKGEDEPFDVTELGSNGFSTGESGVSFYDEYGTINGYERKSD